MNSNRTYQIVVGIDRTEISHVVLETAFDAAARHENAEMHLVHVIEASRRERNHVAETMDGPMQAAQEALEVLAADKLDAFSVQGADQPQWNLVLHVRVGQIVEEIVDLSWETQADIVIIGRHSNPDSRISSSDSVPVQLLAMARCPVLIARATDYGITESLDAQRARQCAKCVAVRSESDGQRWFCPEHSGYRLSRRMVMAHHHTRTPPIGGGPLL